MRSKVAMVVACGAVLALGACERNAVIGDTAALERELATAQAAREAAEAALGRAQNALADAQRVLDAATPGDQQAAQERVRKVLQTAEENVKTAADGVAAAIETAAPDQRAGLEATEKALASTRTALASVRALFPESARTDMHTPLARARTALAQARTDLAAADRALEAAPNPAAQDALTEARNAITTAQLSLLPRIEQELDAAERNSATRATERDIARAEIARLTLSFGKDLAAGGREASRVSPADDAAVTLTPRRSGVTWSVQTGFEATSPSWGVRTRYTIENYGTESAARLAIAQDPVPYRADGGMVIPGADGDPAANEFPGRGQVFRGIGYDHRDFQLPRQGSYGSTYDEIAANDIPRFAPPAGRTGLRGNMRGHAISSFQYREDGGLTMKFGGLPPDQKPDDAPAGSEGSLIFGDLEALTAKGSYDCGSGDPPSDACDEAGTRDLTVSFGAPSRDPLGDPVYHWTVDVPDPRLTIAAGATASLDEAERADPDGTIGRYQMLLANHAGVDDKGTEATSDDSERYLRYAAYGLFQFIDYQLANARPGRMQTFHYGFDAFGTHNPIPAATADSIAATLKGRTMAWLATSHAGGVINGLDRMRANVTLHACIGGAGCQEGDFTAPAGAAKPTGANALTGAIHDLEIEIPGGAWGTGNTAAHGSGHYAFGGDVLLDGAIEASGAFAGTARPDTRPSDGQWSGGSRTDGPDTHGYTKRLLGGDRAMSAHWAHGAFEGVFYGPADALEAAGTWWLPAVGSDAGERGIMGIIGSFGAVCTDCE